MPEIEPSALPESGDVPGVELLRFTTAGSVDDGKSTLIGRLLYDSKNIFEDQLEAIETSSKRRGDENVNLALLTDGLKAEREQGITIDVAYRYFATPKRKFIIADTPGHIQYTRNMVTGASTANLAIILVDARKGVIEQTCRHSFIADLLRIQHVVVAVNKMDLAPNLEAEQCHDQIANLLPQWPPLPLVQISAKTGEGISVMLRALDQVLEAFGRRIATADLYRLVEKAVEDNPPPLSTRRRPTRILYATQARVAPPEIALFTTGSQELPVSWQRFLTHRLREAAGWVGVPVRMQIRTKRGRNPFVD